MSGPDVSPFLKFENLSVSYGSHTVVRGVSGEIGAGSFVALVGPNGSGKSTLIRALGGLLPYRGSVTLNGREVASIPRRELGRMVGILPQRLNIEASFTVYDLIALGRLPFEGLISRRTPADEEKILNSARLLELGNLLFAGAAEISGGEAQRALLAMLLTQDPGLFLLDEPSSAMDVRHSAAVFSLLKRLTTEGRIVLAAVHDVNMALRFADEVIALKNGKILGRVPARDVGNELLEPLYDIDFERYASKGGDTVWHANVRP